LQYVGGVCLPDFKMIGSYHSEVGI
jgi:hypothetical protein